MLGEERYGPTCTLNTYRQSRTNGYKIVNPVMAIFTGIHAHWKKQTAQKSKVEWNPIRQQRLITRLQLVPDFHRAQSSQILLSLLEMHIGEMIGYDF